MFSIETEGLVLTVLSLKIISLKVTTLWAVPKDSALYFSNCHFIFNSVCFRMLNAADTLEKVKRLALLVIFALLQSGTSLKWY